MRRSELRRLARKKNRRKARLPWGRSTERTWMECYRGDPRRLHLDRRQGPRRHQPKAVRQLGRPCSLSYEDIEFIANAVRGCLETNKKSASTEATE